MTTTFRFDLPRALVLTSNQRKHFHAAAPITANLRAMGRNAADGWPPMARAHITARIGWPDKRRRDAPNIWPTLKALIDGIVDAGLLEDDSDAYLIGPDFRPYYRGVCGITRVDLEFVEVPG